MIQYLIKPLTDKTWIITHLKGSEPSVRTVRADSISRDAKAAAAAGADLVPAAQGFTAG